MGLAVSSRLWLGRRNFVRIPSNRSEVGLDKDDWLVCEIRLPGRTDVSRCACCEPLLECGDRARPVRDDPEDDIDSAASVFRRVVRAPPELGRAPVPRNDRAAEKAREARVFGEADDDVEVPYTAAAAQVVLGTALREGDDAHPVLPASKVRVAGEECCELNSGGTPKPSEIGIVQSLVGARWIPVGSRPCQSCHSPTRASRSRCTALEFCRWVGSAARPTNGRFQA
jgi:hypothetical protein